MGSQSRAYELNNSMSLDTVKSVYFQYPIYLAENFSTALALKANKIEIEQN